MSHSPCERTFLVIGDSETARRACASLTEAGRRVSHVEAPSDALLHDLLEQPVDGVAILLWDDIAGLRYCLAVHHIRPTVRLFVTIFDKTVRRQLEESVPDCTIMSTADIAVPSLLGPSIDPALVAVHRGGEAGLFATAADADGSLWGHPYAVPTRMRRRSRLGVLLGQLRPHDGHSQILLGGLVAMGAVLVVDYLQSVSLLHLPPLEALHAAARTLATVGPAEPTGQSDISTLVSAIVMLMAVAATAFFTAGLVERMVAVRSVGLVGRLALPRRGHVVVVGLGQIGLRLCEDLRRAGMSAVAIERHADARYLAVARDLRVPVIIGDGTSRKVLEKVALRRAEALAAVASDDLQNIAVAVAARAVAPHVRIVMRAGDHDAIAETQSLFSIGHVKDVPGIAGEAIAAMLQQACMARVAGLGHDVFLEDPEGQWARRPMAKRRSCQHS
ncbi:MAG TPA: NAD-binding protein [Nocardioidaceae bacterium]|nr:NAD-binding protein [Nocardioidaceae bacterium]